jgi:hypothetical protein
MKTARGTNEQWQAWEGLGVITALFGSSENRKSICPYSKHNRGGSSSLPLMHDKFMDRNTYTYLVSTTNSVELFTRQHSPHLALPRAPPLSPYQ